MKSYNLLSEISQNLYSDLRTGNEQKERLINCINTIHLQISNDFHFTAILQKNSYPACVLSPWF